MGSGEKLTVVIPAFNESGRLPHRLREFIGFLTGKGSEWLPATLLVVDDGSTDETAHLAEQVAHSSAVRVKVIRHHTNMGKGAAVRTGFLASAGKWVLMSDADSSTPAEELNKLARWMGEDRVVIASRAVDRATIKTRQPLPREFMGRAFNAVVQTFFLPGVRDTQCGFKLFPGELARKLARLQVTNGFAFDVELLWLTTMLGYEIVELPVAWAHDSDSRVVPFRHGRDMLKELWNLLLRTTKHS